MIVKLSLIVLLLMSGVSALGPSSNDDKAIRALVAECVDAWNRHDAHAFAQTFAEDADFTNVRGDAAHGRNAVEDFHAETFKTRFKNTHLTTDDIHIRALSPDIASVDIRWEMTGAVEADGTPIPIRKGLLSWVVTRHGDRWLIAVMHNQEFTARK